MVARIFVSYRHPPVCRSEYSGQSERAASADECVLASQQIYADGAWHDAQIIDRLRLPQGAVVIGPALLVQGDATIYVDPHIHARTDNFGNIIMTAEVI